MTSGKLPLRKGMTVVMVLAVVALSLAVSYAVLRSQHTQLLVQQNGTNQWAAENAATTGLSVGLRKMHEASWTGVGTTITGQISATERFEVTYATGDPSLAPGYADYADWPFRVTLTSTGYSAHPLDPSHETRRQVRAVVRLIPRKLAPAPAKWPAMTETHVVYQWGYASGERSFDLEIPCRFEGSVHLDGVLDVSKHSDKDLVVDQQYFGDLAGMASNGFADGRPFNGPIELSFARTAAEDLSLLTNSLGVPAVDQAAATSAPFSQPVLNSTYQIFPGGEQYTIPGVARDLYGASLAPDVVSNPLGVFRKNGTNGDDVYLHSGTTLSGTIIARGDVVLTGDDQHLEAVDLPPLHGTSTPVRLPTAIARDEFKVEQGSGRIVNGVVVVWDTFVVDPRNEADSLSLRGRLVAQEIDVREPSDWNYSTDWWSERLVEFQAASALAMASPTPESTYFPVFLQTIYGLKWQPVLTVAAESSPVRYHSILEAGNFEVYVAEPSDGGLLWEVLRWNERL